MTNPTLTLEGVSHALPDGRALFSDLNAVFDQQPTGLVGRNGVGKTVLARILAGRLAPTTGRCVRTGRVHYLPQQIGLPADGTVASLAGVQDALDALARIEAGSIAQADFDAVGERWDLRQQLRQALERHGLGHLDASAPAQALSGGEAMRVALVGALLSAGAFEVCVRKAPEALIIPTGSELVDCGAIDSRNLKPGQVIESNSFVIGNLIKACGGAFERNAILSDDLDVLRRTVKQAAESNYDLILMIGGSSAGSADFTRQVIEDLGTVLIHGVAMMPGKPVVVGKVNHKPVIGLPGYPVSAIIAFEQLVRPLICRMLSQQEPERNRIPVNPARKIPSKLGTEEFVRVKLGRVGDQVVASPLPRGSGTITSLTQADGIIRISELIEGINAHETVEAELLKPLSEICNTVMVVGSHDNCLDVLADELHKQFPAQSLASNHVGSMGGLLALKRKVAHMAGCHLLDETDGAYNLSYVQKYLPGIPVKIVHLVRREQGLIVSPGNPRSIESIADLTRKEIRFINRQAGSGTRILLDYHLKQSGIDPQTINGYAFEEFTHMNVAVAVLSNAVDAGLGIYAAARALALDFIPVATEEYDLVIPRVHFDTPMMQNLLSVLQTASFQKRVQAMGGYHVDDMGKLKAEF